MDFLQFTLTKVSQVDLTVQYKDEELNISASNVTYKVAKVLLRDTYQFKIFNDFVKVKGLREELFNIYKEMTVELDPTNDFTDATTKKYIHRILDIMDLDTVEQYLRDIGMKPPASLADEFDLNDEKDMKKTRRQTYVKPEFYGLMAIVMVSKALIPVRAITKDRYMIISLLTMVMDHKFFNSKPVSRLIDYIDAHINQAAKTDDVKNRRVLNTGIAADDLTDYVFAIELFNKFPITLITMEYPPSGNIVASIFKYATGIVTGQEKLTDAVRQKQNFRDEGGDDESESVTEGYRQSTRLPVGSVAEFKMVTSDPYSLAFSLGVKDKELLEEILSITKEMRDPVYSINKGSIMLMTVLTHRIIDCRSSESIYRDGMVNMLSVATAYLIENGMTDIARYLLIKPKTTMDFSLSSVNLKSPVKSGVEERIKEKYPMYATTKLKNKEVVTYSIDKSVDLIINYLEKDDFKYILPKKYTDGEEDVILPGNIRSIIVEFLLA